MLLIPRSKIAVASYAGGSYRERLLAIEPDNLIGYWPLDETSGAVALDASGNGRDGAITGCLVGQAGHAPGELSYYFDGINDKVDMYSDSLRDAFDHTNATFAVWFNASTWTGALLHLRDATGQLGFRLFSTYVLYQRAMGGGEQAGHGTDELGVWRHVAMTYELAGTSIRCYFDGVDMGPISTWNAGGFTMTSALLGQKTPAVFHGYMAHAALWTKALGASQVRSLAEA